LGDLIYFFFVVEGALADQHGTVARGHEMCHLGIDPVLESFAVGVGISQNRHDDEEAETPPHAGKNMAACFLPFCPSPRSEGWLRAWLFGPANVCMEDD